MSNSAAIAWSWRNVAYGAALAVPATICTLLDAFAGLSLAVGVLPAAALGLLSTRRERALVVLVGALAGFSIFVGSLVSPWPVVAVATLFVLCVLVAITVSDPARRLAPVAMMLGLPLVGVGLSEGSWQRGFAAAGLIAAGSAYGWLVSLLWTAAPAVMRPPRAAASRTAMIVYGVQIGLAGAVGAALGFAWGADHPGWAATAALMVSRPDRRQLDARGWGRAISVTAGAIVACAIAAAGLPLPVVALLVLLVLAAGSGTAGSRWYVFPFFSTILVLSMLLLGETESPAHWFIERVGLTLVGVILALAAAWVVPAIARVLGAGSRAG
ncbi:FUSC family protein [Microbacterium sp. BK668]|uniref:FUSC family protein n=1 Tax=Microbacterium sp. BK668 TaxID=2512118 RepID=UPI00105B2BAD|nr:FUSC family protein [Microbacterium sp. BK668]